MLIINSIDSNKNANNLNREVSVFLLSGISILFPLISNTNLR
jgi:hypothetical protein